MQVQIISGTLSLIAVITIRICYAISEQTINMQHKSRSNSETHKSFSIGNYIQTLSVVPEKPATYIEPESLHKYVSQLTNTKT